MKLWPELAGRGRYFDFRSNSIPASIDFTEESPLCTTLCKNGFRIRTVEHLLSALEATGVDNCRIEIQNLDPDDRDVEVRNAVLVNGFNKLKFYTFLSVGYVSLEFGSALQKDTSSLSFFHLLSFVSFIYHLGGRCRLHIIIVRR